MNERALPRPSRAQLKRGVLRERAAVARRYVSGHHRPRSGALALAGPGLRWFATGLVLFVGLLLAQQAASAVVGAVNGISAAIDEYLPAPVIDRGPQATAAPVAPNAAPILDPIDKVTKDARLTVSGRLPSFTLGGSVAAKVEIALNGSLAASPAVDADGKFGATVALADGSNTLVVTMVRGTERASALPRTIVLDTTPPTLTVTAPVDGANVDGPSVKITGKTEVGATVTVNGHAVVVTPDGTFTDSTTAGAGAFTIDVVARDQAGNETKKSLRVTVQQKTGTGGLTVSVTLSTSLTRAGSPVNVDVFAIASGGGSVVNTSVTLTVGLTQVASGRTDLSGHFRTTFAAPATEGGYQVVAIVNGDSSGSAPLTVTK